MAASFLHLHAAVVQPLPSEGWKLWLDREAEWKNDELFLPPADLAKVGAPQPTGGWNTLFAKSLPPAQAGAIYADSGLSMDVQVPNTVEAYFWDAISGKNKGRGTSGDYVGVSWWGRDFEVPANAKGKRIKLFFSEGTRQRAEIFVNQKLVGYELVHQTPFEVDITDAVRHGGTNKLAVRITDPNGNFSWGDYTGVAWGDYYFPLSHGFGGILGAVQLKIVDPTHVADIFVKNKPTLTDIDVDVEIANEGGAPLAGTLTAEIVEAWHHGEPVKKPKVMLRIPTRNFRVEAGKSTLVGFPASVPEAKLWGIRDGNLYNLVVTLKDLNGKVLDESTQRFGFRFLSVEGYGVDPRFYLNGKRTFFLSAISWGFWPTNGIFPTPELARRHIASAQALGQNMLNFHRCQGNTMVLSLADEMGMVYYEEPGGYASHRTKPDNSALKLVTKFDLARDLNSQRFLRMVKSHRNHPSLVMYNMVNEPGWEPDDQAKQDMAAAHHLDPTRFISYGSGAMNVKEDRPQKLHMLPYDQTQRTFGYADVHNAGNSPGVYIDSYYDSPTAFARSERGGKEVFIWGEEGAVASPPQLELINDQIAQTGLTGWDGSDYKDWYAAYVNYIDGKDLRRYYPSVTQLITSLGDIMYYEHGRLVENVRIADGAEINILNGYEDMKLDNLSGAVDVFRNLKGNPELISHYMKPLFVAVKARNKIGDVGDTNLVDLFVINEHAVPAGDYTVHATVQHPDGRTFPLHSGKAKISGGDKFSDLVAEQVRVELKGGKGYYRIRAELKDSAGKKIADGHEEIFAVDWKSDRIGGKGAVLGGGPELLRFARDVKKADIVPYKDSLGKLDYVVVGSLNLGDTFQRLSPFNCRAVDGKTLGLNMDLFRGRNFDFQLDRRISTAQIDFDTKSKLIPGYDLMGMSDYSVRWEGFIVPDVSGPVTFELTHDDGVKLWFDDKLVIDWWKNGPKLVKTFEVNVQAGKPYPIKLEVYQAGGGWDLALKWKLPIKSETADMDRLLQRVRDEGTKLLIVEGAETWVRDLQKRKVFSNFKVFRPGKTWVGHNFFVREHPFFDDLPVNGGMNWEYQRLVVYDGPLHFGLYDMKGEEAIVSLVGGPNRLVSTSVGIIPYGEGKVMFSSLDLMPNLMLDKKAASVPRKIYTNYLKWAGGRN
jgi:hypothetical protein